MRKVMFGAAAAVGLYAVARWWRANRRAGAGFVNGVIDPWLQRRGLISRSGGELGLIEHVGRTSGTVRRTPIHPMPTADGYRIIVPIGEQSQWALNVLAAGRCRLLLGDRIIELDEPVLETPADIPGLQRVVRAFFDRLGFRYLRLRTVVPAAAATPGEREPVSV
jgi:deazaflavin-dependent oxidoreductase (nitroreductase family)